MRRCARRRGRPRHTPTSRIADESACPSRCRGRTGRGSRRSRQGCCSPTGVVSQSCSVYVCDHTSDCEPLCRAVSEEEVLAAMDTDALRAAQDECPPQRSGVRMADRVLSTGRRGKVPRGVDVGDAAALDASRLDRRRWREGRRGTDEPFRVFQSRKCLSHAGGQVSRHG